ncbi:bifunctional diguanylate cyclase/phosphodiesterase [Sulfurimonas indica]|uniref:bifunctional diguanylate cyclase/phosphodiesterase n=1 Tax=Sulfurimonas indica TaxID=2508707 RepID=UPI0012652CC9|nr:GGDEF domain-containing phosphodiesterase [Sulfurimonas indica]
MAIQDINIDEFRTLFDMATDVAHVGYWEWDIQTNDVLWSRQKIEIYGEDSETFKPAFEKFLTVIDDETKERVLKEIDDVLNQKKKYYDLQHKIKLKNGKVAWVHEKAFVIYSDEGQPLRMIGIVYDITDKILTLEKLKISQEHTSFLKSHDQLTSLLNKNSLLKNLEAMSSESERFSILFLDIDNFRIINNTYGHLFGDIVLQKVGHMLQNTTCNNHCYRYSADEFVIIVNSECDLQKTLKNIKMTFSKPVSISGNLLRIGFCIGISSYPKNSTDIQELIKDANTALLLAKTQGKEQILFYESYMSDEISKQHLLLEALKDSIKEELFLPYYQPKVNSLTKEVVSFESLVRWESHGKVIPPSFFLHLARENNLINEIDLIMLKKSLAQLKIWHENGHKISISVNFTNDDFNSIAIYKVLQEYQEHLEYLTIEVTESELMNLSDEDLQHLNELKKLGVKLSLDDFGTGYSSLQYIHKLPLDELKIDKAFVDRIPGSSKDEDLVKIIKSIADTFKLSCIVEGVENEEQKEFFKKLNLTTIQGYFYSKPLTQEEATRVLEKGL